MRDVWLYASKREESRELGAKLVELGYRPRHVDDTRSLVPAGDGAAIRPPELAVVVTASDERIDLALLDRLRTATELSGAPVLVALDPAHLGSAHEVGRSHELIVKPFSLDELRLRVSRATRDLQTMAGEDVLRAGELELDLASYRARVGRQPISLRYMEYELLKFLVMHPNRVFTREALLSRVWGYDYYGGARTVDVHVRRIRFKLGGHADRIRTVRSVGYLFEPGPLPVAVLEPGIA